MRDNLKITSTSASGTAHALEFRGQLKTIALSLTAIVLTGLAALTLLGAKALDRCTAPCFVELRRDSITLAPAGPTVAQEILVTGTIPSPARPLLIAANPALTRDHRATPLDASSSHPKMSARLLAMRDTQPIAQPGQRRSRSTPHSPKSAIGATKIDQRHPHSAAAPRDPVKASVGPSALHAILWNAGNRT